MNLKICVVPVICVEAVIIGHPNLGFRQYSGITSGTRSDREFRLRCSRRRGSSTGIRYNVPLLEPKIHHAVEGSRRYRGFQGVAIIDARVRCYRTCD